jgi:protein ImuA
MTMPQPHASALSTLRRKIERLGTTSAERHTLAFGIEAIDRTLPGGGLPLGAVHEITEQGTDGARASLSALFAAGILARLPGSVIWCLHSRDLFAPALARVGLHPDRVIYCETWKDADVLPAMEEGLRLGGRGGRACTVAADAVAPLATGGGSLRCDRFRPAALGQQRG